VDGHLLDVVAQAPHLRGDFGTELEPATGEGHAFEDVRAERLVRGRFVRNARAEKQIRDGGQRAVAHPVGPLHSAKVGGLHFGKKARAIDDVSRAVDDGLQYLVIVAGVVFQVAVLDDDHLAGCPGDPGAHRRTFPDVRRRMVHDDIAAAEFPVQQHTGSIRRAIVDHDHLALAARRQRRGHNAANDFREDRPLVVDGDDD